MYELEFLVRDYELDLQGIVNNAHYLHYLEHARHEYLYACGVDFALLHEQGIDLIVTRIEADYKESLRSRDRFKVVSSAGKEGNLRMVFDQKIIRLPDQKVVLSAKVFGVCLINGKPVRPERIEALSCLIEQQA